MWCYLKCSASPCLHSLLNPNSCSHRPILHFELQWVIHQFIIKQPILLFKLCLAPDHFCGYCYPACSLVFCNTVLYKLKCALESPTDFDSYVWGETVSNKLSGNFNTVCPRITFWDLSFFPLDFPLQAASYKHPFSCNIPH